MKSGLISQSEFITQVQEHLDKIVVDKRFKFLTSQKEEIVDKEYLQQWMSDHQREKNEK